MKAILYKEFRSFFGSPIGYLVIAIFLLLILDLLRLRTVPKVSRENLVALFKPSGRSVFVIVG